MKEGHAGRAQDANILVLAHAPGVGQSQRQEAGHSQHYQVDGNVWPCWTTAYMHSPYYTGVQNHKKVLHGIIEKQNNHKIMHEILQ